MQSRLLFVAVNLEWVHTYSDPELQLFPKGSKVYPTTRFSISCHFVQVNVLDFFLDQKLNINEIMLNTIQQQG